MRVMLELVAYFDRSGPARGRGRLGKEGSQPFLRTPFRIPQSRRSKQSVA